MAPANEIGEALQAEPAMQAAPANEAAPAAPASQVEALPEDLPPLFPPDKTGSGKKPGEKESDKDGVTKGAVLGLMNYLKDLSSSLREKKKDDFMQSDARLSMEYVINTLNGKKGLLKEINKRKPQKEQNAPPYKPATAKVSGEKIAGTLSYLENLSDSVYDKNLNITLRQKVQSIMSKIDAVMNKRQGKHG
jgi:hypothetical protein